LRRAIFAALDALAPSLHAPPRPGRGEKRAPPLPLVQRESLTGEALARLRALSQQDKQLMAAVTATKALLEPPADPAQRGLSLAAAGLVIVIGNTAPQPQVIDATPVSNNPSENE
jgi:hypothetical protein